MFEFTEVELRIAKQVARKFSPHWRKIAENSALEAIWKYRDNYDHTLGTYEAWIHSKAYFWCVDVYRLEFGRVGGTKEAMIKNMVPLADSSASTIARHDMPRQYIDYNTPEHLVIDLDEDLSYVTKNFTPRELEIAQKLANGMTQQAVADEMGLHCSRICQIVKPLREKINHEMQA